jgi:hypothetical protein
MSGKLSFYLWCRRGRVVKAIAYGARGPRIESRPLLHVSFFSCRRALHMVPNLSMVGGPKAILKSRA